MKIRAVGAELFCAEGQRDMTKLMVAFRNYRSAPVYDCNTGWWGIHSTIRGTVHFHLTELCLIVTTFFGTS